MLLLSTAYLAPIQYYTKLASGEAICIEQWEHYSKQSYRNRCSILSANGLLTLSIPVKRSDSPKILTNEIEIEYKTRWQDIHLRAIESAYKNSAYYDYYIDDLISIYEKKITSLLTFNSQLQQCICDLIGIKPSIAFSNVFIKDTSNFIDYRDSIHPKPRMAKPDIQFKPMEYYQVFSEKYGFVPNLSIVDLLFNMGTETAEALLKSKPDGSDYSSAIY